MVLVVICQRLLKVKDIVDRGTQSTTSMNWWLITLGAVAVVGGIVAAFLPVFIPFEAFIVGALVAGGTVSTGVGLTMAYFGSKTTTELRRCSDELVQITIFLCEVMKELEKPVSDHVRAVRMLDELKAHGAFALTDADAMIRTFVSLRAAFDRIYTGRRSVVDTVKTASVVNNAIIGPAMGRAIGLRSASAALCNISNGSV